MGPGHFSTPIQAHFLFPPGIAYATRAAASQSVGLYHAPGEWTLISYQAKQANVDKGSKRVQLSLISTI
jgi:hypothetical protein